MAVKRISELDSAVNIQGTDLVAIVNGGQTRKTTLSDLNTAITNSNSPGASCRVASTANINTTTGGLLTIDGVVLAQDDRVLVWKQTNAAQNGIYVVKSGAWIRAADFDETAEIRSGALVPIVQGTTYKQSIFQLTTTGSPIVGTSNLAFARLTGWVFNETTNIVSLTNRAVHVPSLQVNGGVVKYDADRQGLYDARTLVDKGYVDSRVAAVDSPWVETGSDVYFMAGNVGIGVNAPTADLHLAGSFKFVDGNQQSGKVLTTDNNGLATWQSLPVNALWALGNNNNIYYTPGKVGIGTANPATALHVAGSVRIVDGTQGNGKVLTSNVDGTGSWQALSDAYKTLGVVTVDNTTQLQLQSGANTKLVLVVDDSIYVYRSTGTPDGTTIFPASGGGVWKSAIAGGEGSQDIEGVLTQGNNAGGLQIKNLANPTVAQDADTMAARDAAITALKGGVPTDGDTLQKLYNLITAVGRPRGGFDASSGALPGPSASVQDGDFWRITVGGTISGLLSGANELKPGDLLFAAADGASAANQFFSVQSNVDLATSSTIGLLKLYADLSASNTDGSVTQAALVTALALKATVASPAFTGTPTAPTAAMTTNTTQIATTAFVQSVIDEAVNDLGTVATGTIVIDGNRKNHRVVLTGNVTLNHSNIVPGREYKVFIERATNTTITFMASQWAAPGKQVPVFTDPTQNGTVTPKAVDLLTITRRTASDTPVVVITSDIQTL